MPVTNIFHRLAILVKALINIDTVFSLHSGFFLKFAIAVQRKSDCTIFWRTYVHFNSDFKSMSTKKCAWETFRKLLPIRG